ncbi:cerebellar degeneration-related protein 2-like [Erpetoichthys calabaricus]|uniref:cerebellar degeneration-related protein 2-like n=1 Tax=Erpetoichthys calabaricus TaxID=27687 RepID=UPI002234D7BB|nr:cerebellar degeneration-related protein 2-like [Erpetoichthys calabaricus]
MEELHIEEEEPWQNHRDLERDLHLAAELGKTLLERNKELEVSLHQMYVTNEDQVHEIEYLSKQLDMLRQMNEQHAKVYEQLDENSRDLEMTNQKLVLESKASHQKIQSLTGSIETMLSQVDLLQTQMERLHSLANIRRKRRERRKTIHTFPCLKEISSFRYQHDFVMDTWMTKLTTQSLEKENSSLNETVIHCAYNPAGAGILNKYSELEQRLQQAVGYESSIHELEAELLELQQMKYNSNFQQVRQNKQRENILKPLNNISESNSIKQPELNERQKIKQASDTSSSVWKSSSDTALNIIVGVCPKSNYMLHAGSVHKHGMSILREVDEQYHGLLEKYEELLTKCRSHEKSQRHMGVQTSQPVSRDTSLCDFRLTDISQEKEECDVADKISRQVEAVDKRLSHSTPEYKALFKEIFARIQKTKAIVNTNKANE